MRARIVFHGCAVVVLFASVAFAQSKPKPHASADEQATAKENQLGSASGREAASGMATGRRQYEPAPATARETGSGMATGRKSGSIIVLDRDSATGQASGREASSGMATGRRQYQPMVTAREAGSGMATGRREDASAPAASGGSATQQAQMNARNSAHATESLSADQKQSNPLYQGNGQQGTNPLNQSKDKTAPKPNGTGSSAKPVVEYKDGEDQTTRYRPGNNKTK